MNNMVENPLPARCAAVAGRCYPPTSARSAQTDAVCATATDIGATDEQQDFHKESANTTLLYVSDKRMRR
jgi:hypothetical protein